MYRHVTSTHSLFRLSSGQSCFDSSNLPPSKERLYKALDTLPRNLITLIKRIHSVAIDVVNQECRVLIWLKSEFTSKETEFRGIDSCEVKVASVFLRQWL